MVGRVLFNPPIHRRWRIKGNTPYGMGGAEPPLISVSSNDTMNHDPVVCRQADANGVCWRKPEGLSLKYPEDGATQTENGRCRRRIDRSSCAARESTGGSYRRSQGAAFDTGQRPVADLF